MDFTVADAPDRDVLNEAIWKSVRGAGSTMPAPRSSTGQPAAAPAADTN
jgi:hypothetical protein